MKMFSLTGLLFLLVLSGCATVTKDLTAAADSLVAAQKAGVIPATDPTPKCLQELAASTGGLTSLFKTPVGLVSAGVDAYIALMVAKQAGAQGSAIQQACDPVVGMFVRMGLTGLIPFKP